MIRPITLPKDGVAKTVIQRMHPTMASEGMARDATIVVHSSQKGHCFMKAIRVRNSIHFHLDKKAIDVNRLRAMTSTGNDPSKIMTGLSTAPGVSNTMRCISWMDASHSSVSVLSSGRPRRTIRSKHSWGLVESHT